MLPRALIASMAPMGLANNNNDKMTLLHGVTLIEAGGPVSVCAMLSLIGFAIM